MTDTQTPDVVKWYTRARKFPQLIGRTPDGMKLWGGPYTMTQACGFILVLFVGLNTMSLWARYGLLGNFVVLGTVAAATVFALGRVPVGSRNPLIVATGLWKALASPRHGHLRGKPVRIRRPHRLQHKVLICLDTTRQMITAPTPPPAVRPSTAEAPPAQPLVGPSTPAQTPPQTGNPAPALTGIQALLASATTSQRSETPR